MIPGIGALVGALGGAVKRNLMDDKGFFQGGRSFGGQGLAGLGQKLVGALGQIPQGMRGAASPGAQPAGGFDTSTDFMQRPQQQQNLPGFGVSEDQLAEIQRRGIERLRRIQQGGMQ